MKINIQNNAEIEPKYIRKIEEKVGKMSRYYDKIAYTDVYIKTEGQGHANYVLSVQYGVPGNDVIVKEKSSDINSLISSVMDTSKRQLAGLFGRD